MICDQLSFHVDSAENIRCYLYINGQCTRFLPPDIKMVLPLFFEKNKVNDAFVNDGKCDEMIRRVQDKLRGMIQSVLMVISEFDILWMCWWLITDDGFRAFLKANKVECAWKKEYTSK